MALKESHRDILIYNHEGSHSLRDLDAQVDEVGRAAQTLKAVSAQ
jgi:hypothetical protein